MDPADGQRAGQDSQFVADQPPTSRPGPLRLALIDAVRVCLRIWRSNASGMLRIEVNAPSSSIRARVAQFNWQSDVGTRLGHRLFHLRTRETRRWQVAGLSPHFLCRVLLDPFGNKNISPRVRPLWESIRILCLDSNHLLFQWR